MTVLKLAGVNVKVEESALADSQSNGLADSAVKDVKRCCENESGLSRQTLWKGISRRTPSFDLACEILRGDGEQIWQDSLRAAQGAQVRKSTAAFCGEDPLHDPWSHERGGESRTKMGGWSLPGCV